ncbi:MAG: hypothetical protein ACK6DP_09385 [Gemmatimonas sp.]|uniref:hypothetical protein n=1 Tax=Gemmatimonas sp. TaxID=1962908 RepID=UPI00391F6B16|nr:hypothetical protein [Gemmatimonadota bacterium]
MTLMQPAGSPRPRLATLVGVLPARRWLRLGGVALLLCATALPLTAQIRGRPPARPDYGWWFSGGASGVVLGSINDGATQSRWDFGSDPLWQVRGTLEKGIDEATTLGVSLGYGVVDLAVTPFRTVTVPEAPQVPCANGCQAQTELWSLMGQFRSGGDRPGFHTFFEGQAGVTGFRNLRTRDSTQAPIGATRQQFDLSGSLGFGFGYALSRGLVATLVQDFGMGWHSEADLPEGTSRTWRMRNTRASLRFAF